MPQYRVLILSMHTNKAMVLQIHPSGAQGYVLKDAPLADLLRAIESVDCGEPFFSPDINQIVLNQYLARLAQSRRRPRRSSPIVSGRSSQ